MLCKKDSFVAEHFYWLGLGLLLFYLNDVIIQITNGFL